MVGVLLLACQAVVGFLFFKHRETALVNATGVGLSGLSLICLVGGCVSLVLFLGQPGDRVCRLQQPLNAIFPTVALATILAISLQVIKKVKSAIYYTLNSVLCKSLRHL